MVVTNACFCRYQGQFGLVREYKQGNLRITFDDGDRWLKPNQVIFL